jgi:DNA invertase Pin-like site-specific DNA recombinase
LRERKINFKSLTEDLFDTTTSNGRLVFGIFALLAEHERDRLLERTKAGLKAAKARGRLGGRPKKLNPEQINLASNALKNPNCDIKEIAKAMKVSSSTIYRLQKQLQEM